VEASLACIARPPKNGPLNMGSVMKIHSPRKAMTRKRRKMVPGEPKQ
jgi:hypothetical protein